MKTTGRPCDSASRCANSSRLSVPSTLTVMRRDRRELGAGRKQRREMEDELDLELGEHALEHAAIENRAGDLAVDLAGDRRIETRDVERDDGAVRLAGEPLDETVTDLAAGAGDEHDWFAHRANYTEATMSLWLALLLLTGLVFAGTRTVRLRSNHARGLLPYRRAGVR